MLNGRADGERITLKISPISFPRTGDASSAVRLMTEFPDAAGNDVDPAGTTEDALRTLQNGARSTA